MNKSKIILISFLLIGINLYCQIKEEKTYYNNGNLKSNAKYSNIFLSSNGNYNNYKPLPDGKFTTYYPNGNIFLEGQFKKYKNDENPEFSGASRIGTWKVYSPSGVLSTVLEFNNNSKLIQEKIVSLHPKKLNTNSGYFLGEIAIGIKYADRPFFDSPNFFFDDKGNPDIVEYHFGKWEHYNLENKLTSLRILKEKSRPRDFLYVVTNITNYNNDGSIESKGSLDGNLKSGKWSYYYENGKIKGIGHYKNDEREGEWKFYWENGTLWLSGNYVMGEQTGEWKVYDKEGNLKKSERYEKGEKNGEWKWYLKNGNLFSVGKYSKGEKVGEWKMYSKDGQIFRISNYTNGKRNGDHTTYYENGTIMQIRQYNNDKLMNITACYDNNGNALEIGTLVNGNGTVNNYDKTGKLTSTSTYVDGKLQE